MIQSLRKCSLFELLIFASLFFVIPKLIGNLSFTSFSIDPPVGLTGVYEKNAILNGAERLYENLIKGPDTLVEIDGDIYTGVHGGEVVKLSNGRRKTIAKFGKDCDGLWEESKCGRPFGLAVDKAKSLYVADAYYGIWKIDVSNENKHCLVHHDAKIGGKVPRIFSSLAVDKKGDIYWIDSSTDVDIQNGLYAMFLDGSGRLLKHSIDNNTDEVLIPDLAFPNGLAISPNEDFVVISEMITSRLLKFYISGPLKGKMVIFLDKLPGFPDGLKHYKNYLLVPLVHSRDLEEPVLFQYLSPYPFIRQAIVYFMSIVEGFLRILNFFWPGSFFDKLIHKIGHFETISIFAPTRATILIVNWKGQVVEVWHGLDGKLQAISDMLIINDDIYFGSPYNPYINHVKMPNSILKS